MSIGLGTLAKRIRLLLGFYGRKLWLKPSAERSCCALVIRLLIEVVLLQRVSTSNR